MTLKLQHYVLAVLLLSVFPLYRLGCNAAERWITLGLDPAIRVYRCERPNSAQAYLKIMEDNTFPDGLGAKAVAVRRVDGRLVPLKYKLMYLEGVPMWSQDNSLLVWKDTRDLTEGTGPVRRFKTWYRYAYDFRFQREIAPPGSLEKRTLGIARILQTRGGLGAAATVQEFEVAYEDRDKYYDLFQRAEKVQTKILDKSLYLELYP